MSLIILIKLIQSLKSFINTLMQEELLILGAKSDIISYFSKELIQKNVKLYSLVHFYVRNTNN